MRKYIFVLSVLSILVLLNSCTSTRVVSAREAKPQSSVLINLKDGTAKQGIIFKAGTEQLFYVDAATHKADTLVYSDIQKVSYLDKYFDFDGYQMSRKEIKAQKSYLITMLYGGGGLILGAAAGTGLSVALFARSSNTNAARATIAGMGLAGAGIFGWMGSNADFKDAVFKARKARFLKVQKILKQKREELKRLKQEKEQLKKSK